MTEVLIKIEGLYKIFGKKPNSIIPLIEQGKSKDQILADTHHTVGLKDINLEINKGEIFVIMGLSGSGKSTLIRHFNRLIEPTQGIIEIAGTDVMKLPPKELQIFRQQKMSMVFQHFGLLPHKSVIDNVAYGLQIQGIDKVERNNKAREWLKTVGLENYENHYPSQLSGGQQQRIGLARALCTDADILLMDEAFSALDPLIRSEMQDQLIELQETLHKTIVFITHDLDEALRIGDKIVILKDGELVQQGRPDEILLHPATDYVEAFVRDVNRARALTVETVMKPPSRRITSETIAGAIEEMKRIKGDYAYYVNDEGYQGVVTQETLEQVPEGDLDKNVCDKIWEEVPVVSPEAILETVIPETLEAEYSLPVIDGEGNFKGVLSKKSLAEVLGDREENTVNKSSKN